MKKFKISIFLMTFLMLVTVLGSFTVVFAAEDLGSWQTKASMPTARRYFGLVEANGKIYAIGGSTGEPLNTVEEYDPVTDTWTTKASMTAARAGLGVVEVSGKIYTIGGHDSTGGSLNTVEAYDPVTDAWTTKTSMPTARNSLGLVEANGKIYAMGGSTGGVLNTVEEYDPITDTWTTKASMPTARNLFGLVEANGKIYAIGGSNVSPLNTVEEYDPVTDTWTTKASMPTARLGLGLEKVNGKIYAIGGVTSVYINTVEEYDPLMDNWTLKENMPTARGYFGIAEANGKIYAMGGSNGTYLDSVEEYEPPAPNIPIPNVSTNLIAIAGDSKVDLSWDSGTDADRYNVKRSTSSGGPYTTVAQEVYGTSYTDTSVTNGTTYHYVVTAVNAGGESDNSNEASATPEAPSVGRALLKITMTNGSINEYDLSMTEVDNFITWYDNRANGTGKTYYTIDKNYNVGPFTSRKDYIIFDKVLQFEVMEYTE